MIAAAFIGVIAVAVYVYQHGVIACEDGLRYTSGEPQPSPFHRRFHAWPPRVLTIVTWASFVAMAALLGAPSRAVMFLSLPGVWMCCVMPTTVDGPSMALALGAALLWPTYPAAGVLFACLSGAVHERGPVFAAIYAGSPWLLCGLVAAQWWARKADANHASPDLSEQLVGHKSIRATMLAHRPHVDLLADGGLVWALRGVPLWAAYAGAPLSAWVALGVAFASRLVGTDTARCLMWAAPAFLMHMDPPWWVVALHVISFRRVLR